MIQQQPSNGSALLIDCGKHALRHGRLSRCRFSLRLERTTTVLQEYSATSGMYGAAVVPDFAS
jgi:hypothetical protein